MGHRMVRTGVFAAAAALALPVLALPALADGDQVRLDTSLYLLGRSADQAAYEVTVRPSAGTAHQARLQLAADAPADWASYTPPCHPSLRDGARLECSLGDLSGPSAVRLTLSIPAGAGRLGLLAITDAGNAVLQENAVTIPAAPAAAPPPSPPKGEVRQAAPRPPHPPPRPVRPPAPRAPAPYVPPAQPQYGTSSGGPASGYGSGLGAATGPGLTSNSGTGLSSGYGSGLGSGSGSTSSSGLTSGTSADSGTPPGAEAVPGLPTATASPLLPSVASPAASPTPAASEPPDTSQLSLVTASDVPGGHAAWVKVLGIVVVAEVAVLWLATSLGLWRRRMAAAANRPAGHRGMRRVAGRLAASLRHLRFRR